MNAEIPREKARILVVDDDRALVQSVSDLLESAGYEILTAYDGESGLKQAMTEKPDLMLLDVMMATNTEGFEVSRKIPENPDLKNMRVILLTGIRRAMNLPFAFEPDETWLPVDTVLEKPVNPKVLLETIERKLAGS